MSSHSGFPQVIEFFELQDDAVLVMEWIDSVTLDLSIRQRLAELNPLPLSLIIQYFSELTAAVASLHAAGLIHRDIKPANILVSDAGRIYLTDLDCAAEIANPSNFGGIGTLGWASPEQFSGAPASLTGDIFGLGTTLFYICTGIAAHQQPELPVEPSEVTKAFRLTRPDLPEPLLEVILGCLGRDPGSRFQGTTELQAAVARLHECPISKPLARRRRTDWCPKDLVAVCNQLRCWIRQEIECLSAGRRNPSSFWGDGAQPVPLDLALGLGGVVLALSLSSRQPGADAQDDVRLSAKLLLDVQKQRPEFVHPGLLIGKAGCGLALVHAGLLTNDGGELFARANELSAEIASLPSESVDVHSGLSGQILFHLSMHRITSDPRFLVLAEHCGERILSKAEAGAPGLCWRSEKSHESRNLGYAHGAAGIGDALLSLSVASGREDFRVAAAEAATWLAANILPTPDSELVLWPAALGGKAAGPSWCQGSTGIGMFFLHACQQQIFPAAEKLLVRAARSAAAAPWLGPSLCHGLAGNIDFLLEAYQYMHEPWLLNAAYSLCESMLRSHQQQFSELRDIRSGATVGAPAYLTGYAGVLPVLLRVLDPGGAGALPQFGWERRFVPGKGCPHRAAVNA